MGLFVRGRELVCSCSVVHLLHIPITGSQQIRLKLLLSQVIGHESVMARNLYMQNNGGVEYNAARALHARWSELVHDLHIVMSVIIILLNEIKVTLT
jgi:hypothetical protein